MTDPTASGPNPSGCPSCGSLECDRPAAQAAMGAPPAPDEYDAALARLIRAMAACGERHPPVDWQAECARLTAQLAAATARAGEAALTDLSQVVKSMNWPDGARLCVEAIMDEIEARVAALRAGGGR